MEVRMGDTAGGRLRKRAVLFWILSGVLITVSVGSILFYKNPWLVHRMDVSQVTPGILQEIAESRSPYIKIDGMELSFTGYYKVNNGGKVCSYCYMGMIGDYYILADLPAEDQGAMIDQYASEKEVLEDYTLSGQLVQEDEMTAWLAEAEDMSADEYKAYYHMADVEIHDYDSDQERIRIYQLMLFIFAAGTFAAGWILLSESRIAEKETQEEGMGR